MASKTLVMYFSSTGHTRRAADIIAQKLNADAYEIKAESPYTIPAAARTANRMTGAAGLLLRVSFPTSAGMIL